MASNQTVTVEEITKAEALKILNAMGHEAKSTGIDVVREIAGQKVSARFIEFRGVLYFIGNESNTGKAKVAERLAVRS